ncbi:hypothetical protein AOL_s00097g275 [Orbilia oligospora ATCC 24927]|uniref:Uncharacterized protein n=1 Tax=Arthrobotrys oligospora (strain ATCC 24927 / CBS 115.81 / DSM 1491) TaxID=756982 RepID=G1XIU8_ARTOA|nr:hypothetical protein AOL_s00097g275 [Orbilia oligospora ATCC 24927]EGX46849.1 hypothetical protein AOL_s00097g275 [Orbilia oligospora ATCC 24927]
MATRNINFQKSLHSLQRAALSRPGHQSCVPTRISEQIQRRYKSQISENEASKPQQVNPTEKSNDKSKPEVKKLSVAEADEALRMSMRDIDGGGECSIEMEGGKFVGLRRGVKDNMFRLI